jgi:hypothetical protein
MGIPSDRRFLAVARKHLRHLFPSIPAQPGYFKRRRRLSDTLEWLMGVFASQSPGFYDDLLLVDSTPVECARSRETVKRSQLGDAADYGYCASHSRSFWGFQLHAIFAPDGTPRAVTVASPKRDEREVALELLLRTRRQGAVPLIGDKGYAGKGFAQAVSDMNATILRPPLQRPARQRPAPRADPPTRGEHLLQSSISAGAVFYESTDQTLILATQDKLELAFRDQAPRPRSPWRLGRSPRNLARVRGGAGYDELQARSVLSRHVACVVSSRGGPLVSLVRVGSRQETRRGDRSVCQEGQGHRARQDAHRVRMTHASAIAPPSVGDA